MGLEISHAVLLIERHGADIDAGRIQMGGGQAHAVGQGGPANVGQDDALIAVDLIKLVAGLDLHAAHKCLVALGLGHAHDGLHSVPLGLALVEESLVALGIVHAGRFVKLVIARFFVIEQFHSGDAPFIWLKK